MDKGCDMRVQLFEKIARSYDSSKVSKVCVCVINKRKHITQGVVWSLQHGVSGTYFLFMYRIFPNARSIIIILLINIQFTLNFRILVPILHHLMKSYLPSFFIILFKIDHVHF